MTVSPADVVFYTPPEIVSGRSNAKAQLFERVARSIEAAGGRRVLDHGELNTLPPHETPIVGCSPQLTEMLKFWRATGRRFIYWDRGYARRVYATWLPRGENGGHYRWHVGSYQLNIVHDVPADRWEALRVPVTPWRKDGKHIVVARPSTTYMRFHGIGGWLDETVYRLSLVTDRQLVVRDKESKRPLQHDIAGAHALVTHGSIAAVEAAILGCPVFVDASSAAALVGKTDLNEIERPAYPERGPWLHALAYSQYTEAELVDGTLWRLLC